MPDTTLLAAHSKTLLVLHGLLSLALGGASTHLAIVAVRLLRGDRGLARLARIYSRTVGLVFVAAFGVGLLLYPTFRYHVRAIFLDRHEPWAANLFDIKEHMAALALPFALALLFVGPKLHPETEPAIRPWFALAALVTWAAVAFSIVSGLLITNVRGV